MIISNAKLVFENKIIDGYIEFNDEKIVEIKEGQTSKSSYDAKGLYLLPAFVDSHTHGGYGFDFNMLINNQHNKDMLHYLSQINKEGIGSILLTTITCSDKDLNAIARNYKNIKQNDVNNVIKG
jgi:N-acetylglucosamine-6-phosphate deacetylase